MTMRDLSSPTDAATDLHLARHRAEAVAAYLDAFDGITPADAGLHQLALNMAEEAAAYLRRFKQGD